MFTLVILYTLCTPKLTMQGNYEIGKRIGVESNCGPLFQTLTRLPNVLL